MTITVENDVLTLVGTNVTYNTESVIAQNLAGKEKNISTIKTINMVAPLRSTILISTLDVGSISFPEAVTIQRNGIPITPDNAASYAPYIVWNFSRNNYLQLNNVTLFGTVINIAEARGIAGSCTMSNFKVYGQLFVNSAVLSFGTIYHRPFKGALTNSTDLPDVGEFDASKDGVLIFKDNVQYIKYTVTVSNTGTLPLNDVVLNDTPSSNLKIEEGTIKVDSVSVSGNLLDGLSLGTMQPNVTIFITFYATITI